MSNESSVVENPGGPTTPGEPAVTAGNGSQTPKVTRTFSSEFATMMTCLGAAVGTGNIWRFPRILAKNVRPGGGLGFILCWTFSLFFWSIPMIILEYGLGRKSGKMHINTFHKYLGNYGAWKGAFIVFVQFAVSCYYIVVVSWCVYYFFYFMANPLPANSEDSLQIFNNLTEESRYPMLIVAVISLFVYFSIAKGVKSLEFINQMTVPLLMILIIIGFYYALFLPNASIGIKLIFTMDWSFLATANAFIDAISQNAWDTAAGTGIYLTFATFMKKDSKVVFYAVFTPIINNIVSLMMGVVTFAASFDYLSRTNPEMTQTGILSIMKDNGPANTGLTLVWMPVFFENFENSKAICLVFYFCLCIAGMTSLISMIEMICRQVTHLKLSRRWAAPIVSTLVCFGGFCNTSNRFLANQDYVWGYGSIIAGGYFVYIVCVIGAEDFRIEFMNKYSELYRDFKVPKSWTLLVSLFIPFQIFLLFTWWFEESIRGGHWWLMQNESFLTCVLQWSFISLLLYAFNRIYVKKYHASWKILDDPEPWDPISECFSGQPPVRPIQATPAFIMETSNFGSTADLPSYEEAIRSDQKHDTKEGVTLHDNFASYSNPAYSGS